MKKYVLKLCGCFLLHVKETFIFLESNGIEIRYTENRALSQFDFARVIIIFGIAALGK